MTVASENFVSECEQLIIGNKTSTDVDGINAFNYLLRSGNGLEIMRFGNDSSGNAGVVFIRNGTHQNVIEHDRNAETTYTIGLNRESTFFSHCFNNGNHLCTGLHKLIRSEIANVSGTDSQDFFAQQGELGVHHFLHHGCGVYARNIIVLKSRHERNSSCSNNQMIGLDVENFFCFDILYCYAFAFK
ncbi:hypothetical protein DSECCO2_598620 [anaerobic digester metagenome]